MIVDKVKTDTIPVWKANIIEKENIKELLDKIRAEMQDYSNSFVLAKRNDLASAVSYCIEIIDKYRKGDKE